MAAPIHIPTNSALPGKFLKILRPGNFLAVQWLGLGAFTAVAQVQSPVRELRSCKLCVAAKQNKTNKTPKKLRPGPKLNQRF